MTAEQLKITRRYNRHGAFLVFLCWVYVIGITVLEIYGFIGPGMKLLLWIGVPVLLLGLYIWAELPSKKEKERFNAIMRAYKQNLPKD